MTPVRLLALPLLLTAALGMTACGGNAEDDAKQKAEQFQKDVQSGKLSPDEIQKRAKDLLDDPEIKKQYEKMKDQFDKLPSSDDIKKQLDQIPSSDEIKKQLEKSGVSSDDVQKQLDDLKNQIGTPGN